MEENAIMFPVVRQNGYRIPGAQHSNHEDESRQVGVAKYIESLGGMTNTDTTNLNLKLFLNSNGKLITDRRAINKTFFAWKDRGGQVMIRTNRPGPVVDRIKAAIGRVKQRGVSLTKDQERYAGAALQEAEATAIAQRAHWRDKYQAKQIVMGMNLDKLIADVFAMEEDGFFTIQEESYDAIKVLTVPVICFYRCELQARDNVVNLGRFQIVFRVGENGIEEYISPWEKNVWVRNFYHPHINHDGRICYGSGELLIAKQRLNFNIKGMSDTIRDTLTQYNENSAYAKIYDFEQSVEFKLDYHHDQRERDKVLAGGTRMVDEPPPPPPEDEEEFEDTEDDGSYEPDEDTEEGEVPTPRPPPPRVGRLPWDTGDAAGGPQPMRVEWAEAGLGGNQATYQVTLNDQGAVQARPVAPEEQF